MHIWRHNSSSTIIWWLHFMWWRVQTQRSPVHWWHDHCSSRSYSACLKYAASRLVWIIPYQKRDRSPIMALIYIYSYTWHFHKDIIKCILSIFILVILFLQEIKNNVNLNETYHTGCWSGVWVKIFMFNTWTMTL